MSSTRHIVILGTLLSTIGCSQPPPTAPPRAPGTSSILFAEGAYHVKNGDYVLVVGIKNPSTKPLRVLSPVTFEEIELHGQERSHPLITDLVIGGEGEQRSLCEAPEAILIPAGGTVFVSRQMQLDEPRWPYKTAQVLVSASLGAPFCEGALYTQKTRLVLPFREAEQ